MNRVWKIIEEHKQEMQEASPRRISRISGRKGDGYEEGVRDGMCAALEIIEEQIKSLDEK